MPVRIIENCQRILSLYVPTLYMTTNGTYVELMATEHNDVSVDHRHTEVLLLRFGIRFCVGV